MKPHPRIRKFFKWGGLVVSVLFAAAWITTTFIYTFNGWYNRLVWRVSNGCIAVVIGPDDDLPPIRRMYFRKPPNYKHFWWFDISWKPGAQGVAVPLWFPLATAISATTAAWRMDTLAQRRKRFGGCPACGYDRTGLAANAPCPECNAKS